MDFKESFVEEFKERNFRNKILNIENTPRCTLECPACKRTTFFKRHGKQTKLTGNDLTPEQFRKIIKYFKGINWCGQVSDPIFGKHFIELLRICYETDTWCKIATAASQRPESWYREAFLANPRARWIFGIDGPPEVSHLHRKHQDGVHLFKMMLLAKELGLRPVWQIIVFSFNEDRIDECIEIAKKHNIDIDIIISSRDVPKELLPKNEKYNVVKG
jgi:MoaA/NifB/PqqE/SkfB family radical SAM enzyme